MSDRTPEHAPRHPQPMTLSGSLVFSLRWVLAALSGLMVLAFLYTAFRRLGFPFEYDWVEGGMLASIRHIRSGQPLYQAPSVSFTPFLYAPVYFYVAAALSRLTGLGYIPLRLVSIFATLGCFGVVYALVYAEIRRHLAAFAAVGFLAACYPVLQGNFDIGRVDMLYLFFVLCAFFATRRLHPALAALLWVCAFQTKQGVLPVAVLALCYDWQHPRRILAGLASFAGAMAVSILWLTHATAGWYRFYVFGLASSFGYDAHQAVHFIPSDLLSVCGIALLLVAAACLAAPPQLRSPAFSFYALGSLGMIVFTGFLRAHRGANVNSLLPMYAWIAVLFGLALGRLTGSFENSGSAFRNAAMATLLLAASAQLAQHYYSPNQFLPSSKMLAERFAFEQQIHSIPGDVLILDHPEDGLLAGKSLYAGGESIDPVIGAGRNPADDLLIRGYDELLHSGMLRAVALDTTAQEAHREAWIPIDFLTLYPLRINAAGGEDNRFTSEPRWIYLPCSSSAIALRLDPEVDLRPCANAKAKVL